MSASIHPIRTQQIPIIPMKIYYIIFSDNAPAAITESWKAAEYWKSRGCSVEQYTRKFNGGPDDDLPSPK